MDFRDHYMYDSWQLDGWLVGCHTLHPIEGDNRIYGSLKDEYQNPNH